MKSRFIPLRVLGERLVAAGMDRDDVDAYVLEALRLDDLCATGRRSITVTQWPGESETGDREEIAPHFWFMVRTRDRSWLRVSRSYAAVFHENYPDDLRRLQREIVAIATGDRRISGVEPKIAYTSYRYITVEASAAHALVQSYVQAQQSQPARDRGRSPKTAIPDEDQYLAMIDDLVSNGSQEMTAAREIAPVAIAAGGITIRGRPIDPTSGDDERDVANRLRNRWRETRKA